MLNQQKSVNLNLKTRFIVKVGLLLAIAFVLKCIEMKMPVLFPDFLKIDLSDVPSVVVALSMGSLGLIAGVAIEVLKNILYLPLSSSQFVGEFANLTIGSIYVIGVWGSARLFKSSKYRTVGALVLGGLIMSAFAAAFNYFILLPMYVSILHFPMKAIVDMTHAVNPIVNNPISLVVASIFPFNIVKCTIVGAIAYGVNKKVGNQLQM